MLVLYQILNKIIKIISIIEFADLLFKLEKVYLSKIKIFTLYLQEAHIELFVIKTLKSKITEQKTWQITC